MPSPIGHALGGLAAGCLVSGRQSTYAVAAFAAIGILPDLDFLLPLQHRGPSHSVTAASLVFLGSLAFFTVRGAARPIRLAAALGLAYLSHTLLDWLGEDTWSPRGIMALWPFSNAFYVSGLDVFDAVNRRYWMPGFWRGNAIAVLRELIILTPFAWIAWKRTAPRQLLDR